MARVTDRFRQLFAGNAVDGWLASGVDFGNHQDIGLIERTPKIFPEVLRARIAVRLKKHEQAFVPAAPRGFQRGANLRRMMAVIVNQRDAVEHAFDLEPAADAGEFRQPRANQIRRNIQRERGGGEE